MTESVSFVLLASGVGMGIVFAFLAALSLIMASIRGVDRLAAGSGRASEPASTGAPVAVDERDGGASYVPGHPAWVIAAVGAYLDAERAASTRSAGVWANRPGRE